MRRGVVDYVQSQPGHVASKVMPFVTKRRRTTLRDEAMDVAMRRDEVLCPSSNLLQNVIGPQGLGDACMPQSGDSRLCF